MKKKNLIRNIVITAVAVVLIAVIIVFAILLRQDARGLNYFDRNRVVATAGGESVTMGEYVLAVDNSLSYASYYGYTYSEEEIRNLQDGVLENLLLQKLYLVKLKELGLSLTAEELAQCKKTAQEEVASLEESIGKQLASSSNFSNANLQTQINDYYNRRIGMSKAKYLQYIERQEQASLASEKIEAYYAEQTKNYTEDELLTYYRNYVTESFGTDYEVGTYSMYMSLYSMGYYSTPYLYVPEGFVYVDLVRIDADTEDGVREIYSSLQNGTTFEELQADPRNTATDQLGEVAGPYAIGEGDYSYLAGESGVYTTAEALEVGGIGLVIVPNKTTDEDGNESTTSYTGYIVRRAEGKMCENGAQSGVVDIDYYPGVRDSVKSAFELSRFNDIAETWLADKTVDEVVYTYQG